ncbi:MAG: hypothetical protein U0166_20270 [Acidobacteriota bacterium]
MTKVLVVLAFIGVFIVAGGLLALGREDIFMNGPLQEGHAYMVARTKQTGEHHCAHCHTPVLGASNKDKCLRCHYAMGMASSGKTTNVTQKCLSCHLEHSRGRDPLVPRAERTCRSCHPNAEESHRSKMYIAEQGIPLRNCLNAKGCHLNEYHDKHLYTLPAIDFPAFHDPAQAGYGETKCNDCHGEIRERKDKYLVRFYGFDQTVTSQTLQAWMRQPAGKKTYMHRAHIAKMNLTCKDCHRMVPGGQKPAGSSAMPVDRMYCCRCHASVNTPPRMWCTGPMAPM